jgi:hypothetical protein
MDYAKYYFLETCLFSEITQSFREKGFLTPEEFFAIVIWKANRTKTKIKKKLIRGGVDLTSSVKSLTQGIQAASSDADKLRLLIEDWHFRLPMATAILTVLYPDRFSVYDVRVREQLGIKDFTGRSDQLDRYFHDFLPKVQAQGRGTTLRDKDCYLWGKSWYEDLQKLVKS